MHATAEILYSLSRFAWPIAAIAIATIYRSDILSVTRGFAARLTSAKLDAFGIKSEIGLTTQQSQSEQNPKLNEEVAPETSSLSLFRSPAINDVELNLRESLRAYPPDEHVERLINSLALSRFDALFSKTYSIITQSQVDSLREISARQSVRIDFLISRFEEAKIRFPAIYSDFLFSTWLGYLHSQNLVTMSDDNTYTMSSIGAEFLRWIDLSKSTLPVRTG